MEYPVIPQIFLWNKCTCNWNNVLHTTGGAFASHSMHNMHIFQYNLELNLSNMDVSQEKVGDPDPLTREESSVPYDTPPDHSN